MKLNECRKNFFMSLLLMVLFFSAGLYSARAQPLELLKEIVITVDAPTFPAGGAVTGHVYVNSDKRTNVTTYPGTANPIKLKVSIDDQHFDDDVNAGQAYSIDTGGDPRMLAGEYKIKAVIAGDDSTLTNVIVDVTLTGVEIQLNNTSDSNDDLVRKSKNLTGQIRVTGSPANALAVALTDPTGHISNITPSTFTLNPNGAWQSFSFTGQSASTSENDVKLTVTSGGNNIGAKQLSVWDLIEPSMNVTVADDHYALIVSPVNGLNVRFAPSQINEAVLLQAKIKLVPQGIKVSYYPDLSKLKLSIQQNAKAGLYQTATLSIPTAGNWKYINQGGAAIGGATYQIPNLCDVEYGPSQQVTNDSAGAFFPFYKGGTPLQSNGFTENLADDAPQIDLVSYPIIVDRIVTEGEFAGQLLCQVYYGNIVKAERFEEFVNWAVVQSGISGSQRENFAKSSWTVNKNKTVTATGSVTTNARDAVDLPLTSVEVATPDSVVFDDAQGSKSVKAPPQNP